MSYALTPQDTYRHSDRLAHASAVRTPLPPPAHTSKRLSHTPAALTVTPACDGVYCYSVSESSAWTTTDLLRVLREIVDSAPPRSSVSGNGDMAFPALDV